MEDFFSLYSCVPDTAFLFDKLSTGFKQEPFAVEPGRRIFAKGEAINGLFLIHSGLIKLLTHENSKKGFTISLFNQGNILGLFPVLSGNNFYSHTAISLAPSTLGFISKQQICYLLKNHPKLRISILQTMARYGIGLEEKAWFFYQKSPEEKLAGILLNIASDPGHINDGPKLRHINTNILADLACLSKPKTSRVLKGFMREGYLKMQNKYLQILNSQKLYNFLR